ncbi:carbohydrate kinase family protein [Nakamurella lactea]|uniref:carbohydrate kinase family protein n=1 Tax=Nakamurella lactea TaxID=459515 RepID=UPI00040FE596|nr:carbohydrate kinase family protein [Nakamurella lactea]
MPIIVTGSIATDHLMHFPGKFTDSLLPDQLERVSLSFLVDNLVVHRGGVAGNIAFGMGELGLRPVLVDAVGADFDDYAQWLTDHGVNCDHVLRCDDVQTARFVCTTDDEMNQIGSFYSGAMARSAEIELRPIIESVGGTEMVMIGAGDPQGMIRHSQECRDNGYTFAADPSQQLAFMQGEQVLQLIEGAEYLFTNDYELGLLKSKTSLTDEQILQKVHYRVTTHGAKGVEIVSADEGTVTMTVVPEHGKIDPTGVGDAFRSGFLAGRSRGLPLARAAQVGSLLATLVLETHGTQEHEFVVTEARERLTGAYGAEAAEEIAAALAW